MCKRGTSDTTGIRISQPASQRDARTNTWGALQPSILPPLQGGPLGLEFRWCRRQGSLTTGYPLSSLRLGWHTKCALEDEDVLPPSIAPQKNDREGQDMLRAAMKFQRHSNINCATHQLGERVRGGHLISQPPLSRGARCLQCSAQAPREFGILTRLPKPNLLCDVETIVGGWQPPILELSLTNSFLLNPLARWLVIYLEDHSLGVKSRFWRAS